MAILRAFNCVYIRRRFRRVLIMSNKVAIKSTLRTRINTDKVDKFDKVTALKKKRR